ncbi:Arsenical resistance operon trans-acting repressor ArsD [bioreactor metagenome]|uniref:Arsenical resistance operon trans-acting repressor ArsD n=1 Tax=bioreactor metagenome TaxID=1076179 RepID=A0A645FAC5_9ZZZZ|nr:arsenic metallochaperone ArsD family protein [Citrobacter sp. XY323]MCS8554114.1 arsenic metallochaperone ArsD family protein [Citrobacter sp. XY323]
MSKLEIFEGGGCCATSSVVVHKEAIKWNANFEWAKQNGVDISRYNLVKNPQNFLTNPVVKEFLNTAGMQSLPVTLLDGVMVLAGRLPERDDIVRWANISQTRDWEEGSEQPRCCSIPRIP